ncbi:MAG: branched-chain amino acid ABC transporter permease [Anaerolineae bacterium]|nr:branched-chain amino acid ABC transporter permease [Anaerolineae bacterium]
MADVTEITQESKSMVPARNRLVTALNAWFQDKILHAYLLGIFAGVLLERTVGIVIARLLGLRDLPVLFGLLNVFEAFGDLDLSGILEPLFPTTNIPNPWQQAGAALVDVLVTIGSDIPLALLTTLQVTAYNLIIYGVPVFLAALVLNPALRGVVRRLPRAFNLGLLVALTYGIFWAWGGETAYRELVLMYLGINIILTVSLNLINGYMGEFSVGHAGFMGVGAYAASVLTMRLFTDSPAFGPALLPGLTDLPFGLHVLIGFPIALIAGGVAAALTGLLVAFPSFRTRGDYLAIVTLAVNFIVQAALNNMEIVGGPRGLRGVPLWSNFTWVFVVTLLSIFAIRNLVNSTFGKGIVAIREDEIASGLMSVNTRGVKLVAFLTSSFLAGVAGGLFAHVLAYVNPGVFGIFKSTEALVMVYLGGMGSISGSIIAAFIFTFITEALRPLGVLKWVLIPLLLILLMIYRPQGLFGNRELHFNIGGREEE